MNNDTSVTPLIINITTLVSTILNFLMTLFVTFKMGHLDCFFFGHPFFSMNITDVQTNAPPETHIVTLPDGGNHASPNPGP